MRTYTTPRVKESDRKSSGFSLLEILIALFIGSLMLVLVLGTNFGFSTRDKLERSMETLERAVRFAMDEAALGNKLLRIRLVLDSDPQEFVLEAGPGEDFVLPKAIKKVADVDELAQEQAQARAKLTREIDRRFEAIVEFQEGAQALPQGVRIIGVASGLFETLIFSPSASIYFYPSGEKDGALVVFATEEEMALLTIGEFSLEFERRFIAVADQGDAQMRRAKEEFERWIRQ